MTNLGIALVGFRSKEHHKNNIQILLLKLIMSAK